MKKLPLLLVAVVLLVGSVSAQSPASSATSNVHRTAKMPPPPAGPIYYGGGPIMSGSTNVYLIYYGTWAASSQNIVNTWLSHIGGTTLYNINTTFHDSTGAGVKNIANYNAATNSYNDNYSLGKTLTDASIQTIVSNAIAAHHLPADINGVYFVLTAADVSQSAFGGTLCGSYCGYHSPSTSIVTGDIIKYAIVGNSGRCPSSCDGNVAIFGDATSPNGDVGADGAISIIFHELSETVTDPNYGISGAWGAGVTGENGDMCAWTFGTTGLAPNGSHDNVNISGANYLIQQMFEVSIANPVAGTSYPGVCALSFGTSAKRAKFDLDGDGKTDMSVFRSSTGQWFTIDSSNGAHVGAVFGASGDIPVPADYDGDGKTDLAYWHPADGTWHVTLSSTGQVITPVQWGAQSLGDIPMPGDYDGDGKADMAVFRASTGQWFIIYSSTGSHAGFVFGASGDRPVAGDFDGDGKTDLAYWHPADGTWHVTLSSTGQVITPVQWGSLAVGDIPVSSDFDGDGKADMAVFRSTTGQWFIIDSSTGSHVGFVFGASGDKPVTGDFDGDGKTDLAYWHPADGTWHVTLSSTGQVITPVQWGSQSVGDIPVPATLIH